MADTIAAVRGLVKDVISTENVPHLKGFTSLFKDQTDVLLVLDTKEELPAHALYLSANSSVFSGMLEEHFTSTACICAKDKLPVKIPLPDCSVQEAETFLCYLYRKYADPQLTTDSAKSIVKLAHKFDVGVALQQCDEFLAQQAAIETTLRTTYTSSGLYLYNSILWESSKQVLEWTLFAHQYHLNQLEEKGVERIAKAFREMETLQEFDELSRGLLRKLTRVLARNTQNVFR